MKICLVVNDRLPVKNYGGTQRIVQWLAKEFVLKGHHVTLIAKPGSHLPGVTTIGANNAQEAHAAIPTDVDIVHFHAWEPQAEFDKPWIYTLHGNSSNLNELPSNTVCISANHAQRHHCKTYVYNGVDPEEFIFQEEKKDHLLFFSKVRRRVKGAKRALQLAKAYDQSLVVAGGYRFDLLKVGGLMESLRSNVTFLGEISGDKKALAFAQAKALLFPIDWNEPFGLVMIESLLSGTPVIATARGSTPELLNSDVGAFFESDEEFGDALAHAMKCRPHDCRDWAVTHFSSSVCAQNYLKVYECVLDGDDVF